MSFLDKNGLSTLFTQLKNIFGYKSILDESMEIRKQYLLEIDYEKDLAFDVNQLIGDNSPYVDYARVGQTYVA